MAKLYRTSDILRKQVRTSNYGEEKKCDTPIKVDTVESKLLKELDYMIENKIPLTQTQLSKRAEVSGKSIERYDYIFKDTLEMIKLFQLHTSEKSDDLKGIPDFDKLPNAIKEKTSKFMLGKFDEYATLLYDMREIDKSLVGEELFKKVNEVVDAYVAFDMTTIRIHPDFKELNINKMFDLIEIKYKQVQNLQGEYDKLREEYESL